MPVKKKENIIIYVGLLEKKKKQELQQTVNREIRNLNMHLYSVRSLTEKDMLVYVKEKKKKQNKKRGRKQLDYIMVGRKLITHR